jgi:Tfp pilus assembly protein PilN
MVRWAMAATLASAVSSFPVGMEMSRNQRARALNAELSVINERVAMSTERHNKLSVQIGTLRTQIDRANALRSKRPWAALLEGISKSLPDDIWLSILATNPPRPAGGRKIIALPESKIDPNDTQKPETTIITMEAPRALSLEGYSLTQQSLYEFMSRLKSTGLFIDVGLEKAAEEPVLTGKAVRFKIHCQW